MEGVRNGVHVHSSLWSEWVTMGVRHQKEEESTWEAGRGREAQLVKVCWPLMENELKVSKNEPKVSRPIRHTVPKSLGASRAIYSHAVSLSHGRGRQGWREGDSGGPVCAETVRQGPLGVATGLRQVKGWRF